MRRRRSDDAILKEIQAVHHDAYDLVRTVVAMDSELDELLKGTNGGEEEERTREA